MKKATAQEMLSSANDLLNQAEKNHNSGNFHTAKHLSNAAVAYEISSQVVLRLDRVEWVLCEMAATMKEILDCVQRR